MDLDPGVYREVLMRALVYHGPGRKAWEEVPMPGIMADTDGRILGHEAVGTVESVGQ